MGYFVTILGEKQLSDDFVTFKLVLENVFISFGGIRWPLSHKCSPPKYIFD